MPEKSDLFWINEPTIAAIDFLNSNTTEDDYVFVFSNEALYYYLRVKSPTRFASIKLADTNYFREEALDDLKKHPPKYVLYTTGGPSEKMEGVYMKDRFVEINNWLLDNYPKKIAIDPVVILSK